ncbi:MAG TPA: sigma-70 family RNA polymerase sigma factor [Candidatus Paceibacterota bacterium]|nr:sigma-70 family RNA polymerase sigma factor [Verrucomicrobiota bacterium]HOX02683.1 sigma-70 family RNA polymerase sigma factor [Verrucomicrobiota bacterium]HRZ44376.1 sigma-70 family RNA polymerase sigma factor [Candidatus Paceibacterota bacterium]HRZ93784.1 sigma-70 family RNA polymerase sigma factor [Candidatus Paceibacterota bacterium]
MDAQELGRWFERESSPLVLYARQWLDPPAAEDAVQDVFMSLIVQSQPPEHVKAWLYRAVRNRAFQCLRSRGRRTRREDRAGAEAPGWFEPSPGKALDAHEAEQALRRLDPDEREAVTLRIWGGLTLEEIAAILSCSVATVFRRYQRGIENVRNHLEASCQEKIP